MATLITKNSSTTTSVPIASQLVQGELAVNVTDKRLFTENSGGSVVELGTNPSSLTLESGTANGVAYLNGSKVLTTGTELTFDGTTFVAKSDVEVGNIVVDANRYINIIGAGGNKDFGIKLSGSRAVWRNTGQSGLLFGVDDTEQMRLTSTGLGIGTTSPGQKLDVAGAVRIVTTGSPTGAAALQISADGVNARTIRMTDTASSGRTYDFINRAGGIAGNFGFFDDTAGAYRYIIDASGNLGLGVTPSAWTDYKTLQVKDGSLAVYSDATQDNLAISANAYYQSGFWKYIKNSVASRYAQTASQHQWYTAPSGTAGNAITFTQAMTLDASGNLLVGVTSANANGGVLQLKSGITFPATAVAATDANTLDDYEEGTWVPNQGGGLIVVGAFSSVGRYTKIGNVVTVWGDVTGATSIAVSAIGIICTNLPFALQSDIGAMGIAAGFWTSMNSAIHISTGATTSLYSAQAISGSATIGFTITYRF
jgi:hypothetical protein